MTESLRRLMAEAIDHAGIFPPARLSMGDAVAKYRGHTAAPEAWMLGRFISSAGRLNELAELLDDRSAPLLVSVVGTRGGDRDAWEAGLEADAKSMNQFLAAAGDRAEIVAFEAAVPNLADMPRWLNDLSQFASVDVFAELPMGPGLLDSLALVAEPEQIFVKARTGSEVPAEVPSSEELASFIHGCISLDLPFKLTAGLHAPLSHGGAFGFLNVLASAALCWSEDLTVGELKQLLEASDGWQFTDQGVQWGEFAATTNDIAQVRELFKSFGSCSVDDIANGLKEVTQ